MEDELKEFVADTLRQINEGKGSHSISHGIVRFELAVVKKQTKEGKVQVGVLGLGGEGMGEVSDEKTSKISFEIIVRIDS